MQIRKIFSKILVCVLCVLCLHCSSFAAGNIPYGDIGDYGNWITKDNMEQFNANLSNDMTEFQSSFETKLHSTDFVPIEVKLGLVFMKALSSIDYVLQISLVRFTILFLIIMYAFWIGLTAYQTIRDSTDYKTVLYDIFKKGFTIAIWIMILEFGPAKIFSLIITPIIGLGTYLSDFILDAVAQTYNVTIPDTCATIHQYVDTNNTGKMLIDPNTAANIMCLPGRLSVYFYHAVAAAWKWMISGFGNSATAIAVGATCIVLFIKCIFKYAFMTLGIVADLFLTLLMLPFTALAESSLVTPDSKSIPGRIYEGFLKMFSAKKLSDVISVFINTAIYFISLSIIIAISAALLTNIISISSNNTYNVGSAITTILCGCLVLYFADKTDEWIKKLGGEIDNSFGKQLESSTKTLWGDVKKLHSMAIKDWIKKK